jgi:purine-nucleoside phosphorylase
MTPPDQKLAASVSYIREHISQVPSTAIVLGSGLGDFQRKLAQEVVLQNRDIPYYPVPHIEGHPGRLVFGRIQISKALQGSLILVFVGRSHFYESGDLEYVRYPIRVAHALGVKNLILTNASGAVNAALRPGELMLITGQINLTFQTPRLCLGRSLSASAYDPALANLARLAASKNHIFLREGVYCGVIGPSYETPAEIEMIRRLKGDAVGMSTVHESTTARQLGMRVLGISLITNLAAGLAREPATHDEVIRVAHQVKKRFEMLLTSVLGLLERDAGKATDS